MPKNGRRVCLVFFSWVQFEGLIISTDCLIIVALIIESISFVE